MEDVDTVFADEPDIYYQLSKLLTMTKIPVILTVSSLSGISKNLIPMLQKKED